MNEKNVLLVFAKNPVKGKVKTRLAKSIGAELALKVYLDLVIHTKKVIEKLDVDVRIYYSDLIEEEDLFSESEFFGKFLQEGVDLGQRMFNAFDKAKADGYQKIVIIGTDLFELKSQHLKEAFNKLTDNHYVIGPSKDGGYYLFGMNRSDLNPKFFKNKLWSSSTVLSDTLKDISESKVFQLEELNDIDTFEDLKQSNYYHLFLSKYDNNSKTRTNH